MTGDKMYFSDLTHTLQNISTDEKAVFVSGQPGSGKTFTALQFCAEHKESLYFPFKNLDTAFALRVFCNSRTDIFGGCESWNDFFGRLKHYGNKKHPLVFFDNAGERNDKDDFYAALNSFYRIGQQKNGCITRQTVGNTAYPLLGGENQLLFNAAACGCLLAAR